MAKQDFPVTQAIRFLRSHNVAFEPRLYEYEERGGTAHSAECLGVDEHHVIKTIVCENEKKHGIFVLMHGVKHIYTRQLARDVGMMHIDAADPKQANKWTGYLVGGTSPFGTKTVLPVYVEASILALDTIYINGGKRGFLVVMQAADLQVLQPVAVNVAVDV